MFASMYYGRQSDNTGTVLTARNKHATQLAAFENFAAVTHAWLHVPEADAGNFQTVTRKKG